MVGHTDPFGGTSGGGSLLGSGGGGSTSLSSVLIASPGGLNDIAVDCALLSSAILLVLVGIKSYKLIEKIL